MRTMADEKRVTPESTQRGETLRETAARLEQRVREIPAWKLGTIVFAERPQSQIDTRPSQGER